MTFRHGLTATSLTVVLALGSVGCTNLNKTQSGALSAGVGALIGGGLGALAGGVYGHNK